MVYLEILIFAFTGFGFSPDGEALVFCSRNPAADEKINELVF